jgi:thiaminase/transcriptional activator TenA
MKWSEHARRQIEPIYNEIITHPFITELTDGSLNKEQFIFYIRQDALYLAEYAKILAAIAAKLDDTQQRNHFLNFSRDTIAVENALHGSYLHHMNKALYFQPSPTCLLYTSYHHKQVANAPVEVAVASVLPCFRVYKEVGDHILARQKDVDNPYKDWIETYGGAEYAQAVNYALEIGNALAEQSTEKVREQMTEAFMMATRMEWMFWDSAWRLEQWQV